MADVKVEVRADRPQVWMVVDTPEGSAMPKPVRFAALRDALQNIYGGAFGPLRTALLPFQDGMVPVHGREAAGGKHRAPMQHFLRRYLAFVPNDSGLAAFQALVLGIVVPKPFACVTRVFPTAQCPNMEKLMDWVDEVRPVLGWCEVRQYFADGILCWTAHATLQCCYALHMYVRHRILLDALAEPPRDGQPAAALAQCDPIAAIRGAIRPPFVASENTALAPVDASLPR